MTDAVALCKFISKKGWRQCKADKILHLTEQYPHLDKYLHTEMVLDWIAAKRAKQDHVTDFWDCSVHLHLNTTYQDIIRKYLRSLKYEVSYVCRTKEVAEYNNFQSFTLDRDQIDTLLAGENVKLSGTCNIVNCNQVQGCRGDKTVVSRGVKANGYHSNLSENHSNTIEPISDDLHHHDNMIRLTNQSSSNHHVVTVRLVESPTCEIVVVEGTTPVITHNGHNHTGYKHWFILTDGSVFVSLSASTTDKLSADLRRVSQCTICVVMVSEVGEGDIELRINSRCDSALT